MQILHTIISEFEFNEDNKEIFIYESILDFYTDFENGDKLKQKVIKLLKIFNEEYQKSDEDFKKFLELDIEKDIWKIL